MSQYPLPTFAHSPLAAVLLFLALSLLTSQDAAAVQCPGDDGVGNNSLASAEVISNGSFLIEDRVVIGVGAGTLSTDIGNDWFVVYLSPGAELEVSATQNTPGSGLYLQLYSSTAQVNFISGTLPSDPLQELTYTNTSASTVLYLVRVANANASLSCVDYDLDVKSTNCSGNDIFGGIDTCEAGLLFSVVPPSVLERMAVQDDADDWFRTQLMPGDTLTVDLVFEHATADVDLVLRDRTGGSCGSTLTSSSSVTDNEMITYTNNTSSVVPVGIGVLWYSSSVGNSCCDYELYYDIAPAVNDAFEENDDICSASGINIGVYEDLNVSSTDSDFYYVDVYMGQVLTAAIDFDHSEGDLDMRLWNIASGCGSASLVDSSGSTNDYEEVTTIAGLAQFTRFAIEVYNFTPGMVTDYQLTVGENVPGDTGQIVCLGVVNSINRRGWTRGNGSPYVTDNSFSLTAYDLPSNTFGFFNASMGYRVVGNPGGSEGNLCIAGGAIGRFVGPGQIMNSGANGEFTLPLDLGTLPQPGGAVAASSGETWFFQCWYRDAFGGITTSNFTGALRVRFL